MWFCPNCRWSNKDVRFASAARVAARYKSKKKVETKDGDDITVYEYSDRQIANRHREKAERVEHLRQHMSDLRDCVRKDLKAKDTHRRMVALAVSLMDQTCERVGNDESAKDGHFGVTGWKIQHVTFKGDKATIKYVGKSGVDHTKTVDHGPTVTALKDLVKGRGEDEAIFDTDDAKVTADDVNQYLKKFDVTAKDIRGFRANDEMCKALRDVRAKGPKDLPRDRKERDKILKAEFKEALEQVAETVGHEASTLRSQYLVPGLEDSYVHDGTVLKSLKTAAAYPELPVSNANLPSQIRSFFSQHAWVFRGYPELWVKGGAARNALLSVLTGTSPAPPRDVDLVLIGETYRSVCYTIADALGLDPRDVECIPSLSGYFSSRDLGVNEVLLRPDRIMFTENARRDVMKGHATPVRPEYEQVTPRVALRGVLIALREGLKIHPQLKKGVIDASPFDLLIHLFKAFDSGVEDRFFNVIRGNPHLRGTKSAERALFFLLGQVRDFRLTDSQNRIVQQLQREDEYGNRYATKTDSEREDEAVSDLVKPAPKKKPPRHDLRNERVTEEDPDTDTTDDDLSLNFKKVAVVQSLVWLLAERVAHRHVTAAKEHEDAFQNWVKDKKFKSPKSGDEVAFSTLEKHDPKAAQKVRKDWAKEQDKSKDGDKGKGTDSKDDKPKDEPASDTDRQNVVESIQDVKAGLTDKDMKSLSGMLSGATKGQTKDELKDLAKQTLKRRQKLISQTDPEKAMAVPDGMYGKEPLNESGTFDADASRSVIDKASSDRGKTLSDLAAAEDAAQKGDAHAKAQVTVLKTQLKSQTKDLNRMVAYHAAMTHYVGHMTDPKKGSSDPAKRVTDALETYDKLSPELASQRKSRVEGEHKRLTRELEKAPADKKGGIQKDLDALDAEIMAVKYKDITSGKADKKDPVSFLVGKTQELGPLNKDVQTLLKSGVKGEKGAAAVQNLSKNLNDDDLASLSGASDLSPMLKGLRESHPSTADAMRSVMMNVWLLQQGDDDDVDRTDAKLKEMSKSFKHVSESKNVPSSQKDKLLSWVKKTVKTVPPKVQVKLKDLFNWGKQQWADARKWEAPKSDVKPTPAVSRVAARFLSYSTFGR